MDNDIYFPFSYDESVIYDQTNTSIEQHLEKKLGHQRPDRQQHNHEQLYQPYRQQRDNDQRPDRQQHNNGQSYNQRDHNQRPDRQQRDNGQSYNQRDQPEHRETFAVGKKQSCNVKWSTERILLCIIFVLIVCCVMQYITQQELTIEMNNLIDALKYSAYQQQQQHNYHQQVQRHAQNPQTTPAPEPLPLPPLP